LCLWLLHFALGALCVKKKPPKNRGLLLKNDQKWSRKELNYQFPLFLRDFCSITFASLNAAANTRKKSLIANKGLKLIVDTCCNCTEFEFAMVSSLRVNPNDTPYTNSLQQSPIKTPIYMLALNEAKPD